MLRAVTNGSVPGGYELLICIPQKGRTLLEAIRKLEDKTFHTMGQLVSWSVGHGGPGLPMIAEPLYLLMTGQAVQLDTCAELITDPDYFATVKRVRVHTP